MNWPLPRDTSDRLNMSCVSIMMLLDAVSDRVGFGYFVYSPQIWNESAISESLAAWINRGGEGRAGVRLDGERLVVQTAEGASSKASVVLDWLRVGGDPIMRRARLVTSETSTASAAGGSAVAGEYLNNGAASSAAADPTFAVRTLTPKHAGTVPIRVTRNVLATAPDVDAWLTEGVRASLRRTMIKALLAGTGADGQPTGIYNTAGSENPREPRHVGDAGFRGP